jgi:hypothetical protein
VSEDRLQAAVERIKANILAAQPDAAPTLYGGILDAYGSVEWTPSRMEGADFSSWGDWEAWEHQKPDGPRLVPTGDWAVWHAPTGQIIGFPGPNARFKAEGFALFANEGKKTRVVPAAGGFQRSFMDYETIRRQIAAAEAAAEKE